MPLLFESLSHQIYLSAPLFILILLGYCLTRLGKWPASISEGMNRFVFNVALPCMLLRVMSTFSQSPPVDARLLLAFFGSCLLVFIVGRLLATRLFNLDGVAASVFALGGIFSNNVMLGIPVATVLLGPEALPPVALVLVFNSLILWTLLTVSVEWAKQGSFSLEGLWRTLLGVLKNPLIIGILSGTAWSFLQRPLPLLAAEPLKMLASLAAPLSLVTLGMSLAHYRVRDGLKESYTICLLKLVLQPMTVWAIAWLTDLPPLESKVVVLLGSMAVGVNVYLMSQKFNVITGPAAASMLFSTVFAAVTTPIWMMLMTLAGY
ncbi:AEC family transporter [Pantoea agglomerans]|uniref:AEC family transporter n=1 Tax=Enterobacter agglomerans TaxID=549 RepID=UPI001F3BA8D8|nr:AEC family transporter [Pantoea agglomerans]UJQ25233.1 AEC family transporter [Pantoea agglomerans]